MYKDTINLHVHKIYEYNRFGWIYRTETDTYAKLPHIIASAYTSDTADILLKSQIEIH